MTPTNEEDRKEIIEAVKNTFSIRQLLNRLNILASGGNYELVRKWIEQLKLDISHWSKQRQLSTSRKPLSVQDLLVDNIWHGSGFKNRLIREGILTEQCVKCKIGPIWNGEKLVLHLDHISGKRNDNRLENLRLLCPNCHSQTDTYCGKNRNQAVRKQTTYGPVQQRFKKERPIKACFMCGKICEVYYKKYCSEACHKTAVTKDRTHKRKVDRPDKETLNKMIWDKPATVLAKELGVSGRLVKKWCERYGLKTPGLGYWAKVHAGVIDKQKEPDIVI